MNISNFSSDYYFDDPPKTIFHNKRPIVLSQDLFEMEEYVTGNNQTSQILTTFSIK